MATFYKLPNGNFVRKERKYGTTFKQNKKTGLMEGRKSVKGKGDKTGIRRVKKDFVLVKQSKTARGYKRKTPKRKKYIAGQILGRT